MNGILSLQELFNGRVFTIPDYQRGYAWSEDQWRDLRDDLRSLPDGKHHYTGTIVLRPTDARRKDNAANAYQVCDVVDGQQRLTSLTILLRCIAEQLRADDPASTMAAGLTARFLQAQDRSGQPLYKLTLNADCAEYFQRNVLGADLSADGPTLLSHRRLSGAKAWFTAWLDAERETRGDNYAGWLIELYDKVTDQLKVSLYEVADEAEVGVIFEVMNDRGKPLSELEKVKNFLLYTGSKLQEEHDLARTVNTTWRAMLERLMQADLGRTRDEDALLRSHWLALYDPERKNWDGSRSIKTRGNLLRYEGRHAELLQELLDYVRSLGDASVAYCDAYQPRRGGAFSRWADSPLRAEVVRWSEKLLRLDATRAFIPLLIAARRAAPDDVEGYLTLVKACEVFAFRVYRVAERRSDAGRTTLFRHAFALAHGNLTLADTSRLVRELCGHYCGDGRFKTEFAMDPDYTFYHWGGLRYFLYEYEEHLADGKPYALSWDKLRKGDTIEHILPQTPTKWWKGRFDKAARKLCTHDLGNLCLTYDNSSYGNKSFPEKVGEAGAEKRCYATAQLAQEQELAKFDDWTEASVRARRKTLIAWAKERWAL